MRIQFDKMTGAGNDFVVVDNRGSRIKNGSTVARRVCDRNWGIGADGLLLLEKSKVADYRMIYYNADGSYGGMCGNGGRCIARFALAHRIAAAAHQFEALDFVYEVRVAGDHVRLAMKNPTGFRRNIMLRLNSKKASAYFVDTGSPHVVIPVRKGTLQALDVVRIGRRIAHSSRFGSNGTNVNFVEMLHDKRIQMRTFERGVEAETLACGTGSIACAIVADQLWKVGSPAIIVASSGKRLEVSFSRNGGRYERVMLSGPAEFIFSGSMDI